MSTAAAPQQVGEAFSNGSFMNLLTRSDLDQVARILDAPSKHVDVQGHPLDDTIALVLVDYTHINVASAVACHLNNDQTFYKIPNSVDRSDLHYQINMFAYVDAKSYGHRLCLTVDEQATEFVKKLDSRADDVHFVVSHPDILFLRPYLNFQTAKSHLNAGYKISALSL